MENINLFKKTEKKRKRNSDTSIKNMYSGYRNEICHAHFEKLKKSSNRRSRTSKSRKN